MCAIRTFDCNWNDPNFFSHSYDRYIAACAPHVQRWGIPPPLRGSYDYMRLVRQNHMPLVAWTYGQMFDDGWDAKVSFLGSLFLTLERAAEECVYTLTTRTLHTSPLHCTEREQKKKPVEKKGIPHHRVLWQASDRLWSLENHFTTVMFCHSDFFGRSHTSQQ